MGFSIQFSIIIFLIKEIGMTNSKSKYLTLLALDIGEFTTRAMLFDVVEGQYSYLAGGESFSTIGAPFLDVSIGICAAIEQIQSITGRSLLDSYHQLIIPERLDGSGIDSVVATLSIGQKLKTVIGGLLDKVSLESAKNLARTTYCQVVDTISLNDRISSEDRINKIVKLKPDLIIVAGGLEDGASKPVLDMVEAIGLAASVLPEGQRPRILYAGNSSLWDEITIGLDQVIPVDFVANIRPNVDHEQLDASRLLLARLYTKIGMRRHPSLSLVDSWTDGKSLPESVAFGRIIQFLSKTHPDIKGVLGVNLDISGITYAGAYRGDLVLASYPEYGFVEGLENLEDQSSLAEIAGWAMVEISPEQFLDKIGNKALHPASLPLSEAEMELEQAILRVLLRRSIKDFSTRLPGVNPLVDELMLPPLEPIILTGDLITHLPGLAQTALLLLDGLQPTGVTTLILDQNQIAPALGAAAEINPTLTVHVLDTSSFLHLGTVISPVGHARPGTPVLRLKITYSDGRESVLEIKQGTLETIPLAFGEYVTMHLQPLHKFDIGMGAPGRGGDLKVTGGLLGIIVDARGRPFSYPADVSRRKELVKKWLWTMGGH